MAYIIESIVAYSGVLLLLGAYSLGNPLPARDPRSTPDSTCNRWQLDSNSTTESVILQVFNSITAFNRLVPNSQLNQYYESVFIPLKRMLLEQPKYKLGLQAVCRMYYISLRYNSTEESDDEHIILSYKYVAQRAMEVACRWVQIEFGDSGAVNCTLEDIDAICIEFQRFELHTTLHGLPSGNGTGIASCYSEILNDPEQWFNCTRSQNQDQLWNHPDAVTYILEKIRPRFG